MAISSNMRSSAVLKRTKQGTASKKKHRFQSFNQRVAKLQIDPIRKRRRLAIDEETTEQLTSYFILAANHWKDLNLSENYRQFSSEVEAFCQSLAQVIHHDRRIFDLLLFYINKQDPLSLEPLLDLLAHFARDLGQRFEALFPEAVRAVATLAAQHVDVQVIEWSFTCLSWLFKYLSRLLAPNLGPLYRIMAPFLGKETQKPYTTRFAAEAMSFLIRKAACAFERNAQPLRTVIRTIYHDLCDNAGTDRDPKSLEPYKYGVMTLIFNAIKGIDRKLSSYGLHIYRCLFETLQENGMNSCAHLRDVLYGTTIGIIHHTDCNGLEPILSFIVTQTRNLEAQPSTGISEILARLLFLVSVTRKGSRVADWESISNASLLLLRHGSEMNSMAMPEKYKAIAVILQSAPMSVASKDSPTAMKVIADCQHADLFLSFCEYFHSLGHERFERLLMPYLAAFVTTHWKQEKFRLLLCLPRLVGNPATERPVCPPPWRQHILRLLHKLPEGEIDFAECFHSLQAMQYLDMPQSFIDSFKKLSEDNISRALREATPAREFILGPWLRTFVLHCAPVAAYMQTWWPQLCQMLPSHANHPLFLESILVICQNHDVVLAVKDRPMVISALTENLHTASPVLRKLSLEILEALGARDQGNLMHLLSTIENSPATLQSARFISMQARKLASAHNAARSDYAMQRVVPSFCFGMLTYKLAQAQDDAVAALKTISEGKEGQDAVSHLTIRWLETSVTGNRVPTANLVEPPAQTTDLSSEFYCSDVAKVDAIEPSAGRNGEGMALRFEEEFQRMTAREMGHVGNAPSLALKVLGGNPSLTEKLSSKLVPLLLSWANEASSEEDELDGAEFVPTTRPNSKVRHWPQSDRKALLNLFTNFKNPQKLLRADQISHALKRLLCNGDADVQRSALKALFAWSSFELIPYQARLLNLLDDSLMREEIATLLNLGKEDMVHEDHKHVLMPIVVRILYGRMITRTGNTRRKVDKEFRAKAILQAVAHFDDKYVAEFILIALGRLAKVNLFGDSSPNEIQLSQRCGLTRKQLGTLNTMKMLLEALGSRLEAHAVQLLESLLYCFIRVAGDSVAEQSQKLECQCPAPQPSTLKAIRHTCYECLNLMARHFPPETIRPYIATFYAEILSPRLERLAVEVSQALSGVLRLLSTWAGSLGSLSFLFDFDTRTLPSISMCLNLPSCKDEIKLFVMENIFLRMLRTIQRAGSIHEHNQTPIQYQNLKERCLNVCSGPLLANLPLLLQSTPNKAILGCGIALVNMLALMTECSSLAKPFVEISVFLLNQPPIRVSPKSKGELLQVLARFLQAAGIRSSDASSIEVQNTMCSLFGYFKDRENRVALSDAFRAFAASEDVELVQVADLCQSLNAYAARKIDEPDYDERLRAFNLINEKLWSELSIRQWRPLIENMLFFLKEEEEFAIRSNAAFALRRFIEAVAKKNPVEKRNSEEIQRQILLPKIIKGAVESSEHVRSECLGVLSHLIRCNPQWPATSDLLPLLAGNDEEASFFSNILHIQQHRRVRALRRLASHASSSHLRSANVSHFLIPLTEHFIFNKADDELSHNISAEAVTTVGALASSLEWRQFRAIFRRYCTYLDRESAPLKSVIKLLGTFVDALSKAMGDLNVPSDHDEVRVQLHEHSDREEASVLARTLPNGGNFSNEMRSSLLFPLEKYVHDKDEATVSLRVLVATSAVKLIKLLPGNVIPQLLPPLLTDTCNILRSRAQESRDLTRKTLAEISTVIGPCYFSFILKELRTALARGYQLHVLAFTVHSILVETSTSYQPGDLDHCLPQIVTIVVEDVLGKIGQEKDAEEYVSKMKEVKSRKSFDTMELLAKVTTVSNLIHLIRPLQSLLEDKMNLGTVRKIEELLRRISAGLVRNDSIANQQFLTFCHEVVREATKTRGVRTGGHSYSRNHKGTGKITMFSAREKESRSSAMSYKTKLVPFAFDTLRAVIGKFPALQTPSNFHGFIPLLGDALVQPDEDIQISAIRLLTTTINIPLRALDENGSIYISECVRIIRSTGSTNVRISQAAYKLVSVILRDRHSVEIREGDIAYLLKRLVPDLEQPDKQGGAFNFVKGVMTRKIVIPEVYEIMDSVAVIMVTNQTRSARDAARGAYVQFIMEYPQGKDRFFKQIGFLIRNLSYDHVEGRQSVMEVLHSLFMKPGEESAQEVMRQCFVPLVMTLINDESGQCREMAAALLRVSLERANEQLSKSFVSMLKSWLNQADEPLLRRAAFQTYGLLLDTGTGWAKTEVDFLLTKLSAALEATVKDVENNDWELAYYVLQDTSKICQTSPLQAFAASSDRLWACIRRCLLFPHAWVKASALKLMGTFYADVARSNANKQALTLPLKGSGGLSLNSEHVIEVTKASLTFIKYAEEKGEETAGQCVRNLVFLGRMMLQTSMLWPSYKAEVDGSPDNREDLVSSSDEDVDVQKPQQRSALDYLVYQVSRILRCPPSTSKAQSLIPWRSSLRLLGTLVDHMDLVTLRLNIPTILIPLNNLTDPTISAPSSTDAAFNEDYNSIVSHARELMSKMQEKLGTTEYLNALHSVREKAKERREGRRTKRAIERVAKPQQAERIKRRKGEKKKEKRKQRYSEHRAMRRGW